MQASSLVAARFERYFRHPSPLHEVLKNGDRAVACRNIRKALFYLGKQPQPGDSPDTYVFGPDLAEAVRAYQLSCNHVVQDGEVGPNTRRRLVSDLMDDHGAKVFGRLDQIAKDDPTTVFLSYASEDSERVDKLDQWLRDRSVHVLRDNDLFLRWPYG